MISQQVLLSREDAVDEDCDVDDDRDDDGNYDYAQHVECLAD